MAFGNANSPTGERNKISSVSVNGSEIVPENKNVNIKIPLKFSDLENDKKFTTYTLVVKGGKLTLVGGDGSESSVDFDLATEAKNGLLSAADKKKINSIKVEELYTIITGVYTGTGSGGSAPQTINLGVTPKVVIIKPKIGSENCYMFNDKSQVQQGDGVYHCKVVTGGFSVNYGPCNTIGASCIYSAFV